MTPGIALRAATAADEPFLAEMLGLAAGWRDGGPPPWSPSSRSTSAASSAQASASAGTTRRGDSTSGSAVKVGELADSWTMLRTFER